MNISTLQHIHTSLEVRMADEADPKLQTNGGSSPGRDLPKELLDAGWRKFFSKREGRPYFFNKFTNQSLWEQPTLDANSQSPHYFQDPLGISTPSPSAVMSPPPALDRRSSLDLKRSRHPSTDGPGVKKPFTCSAWNFQIPTNAIIHERAMSNIYPPHPEVEFLRSQLVSKLRAQYEEICQSREKIASPIESFNRWLLERKVCDMAEGPTCDPILASECPDEVSSSMFREIMNDIPVKLIRPKYISDARKQLSKYAESAKKIIEERTVSPESRKLVIWNAEETFQWLRENGQNASYEDYLERLAHVKRQCQPHLIEASRASVESICRKMYNLSREYCLKLHELAVKIWKENQIEEVHSEQLETQRKVFCYPRLLGTPSPRLPTVTVKSQNNITTLTYKEDPVTVNNLYFYKLESAYKQSCKDDGRCELFVGRVWCLLKRYKTYFGTRKGEGLALQAALPTAVFECLNRLFGVTFELFASPLNCYYKQYCSAFADTDGYFGSRGPVLDFHPLSGSFEANPPFSEELMETMVNHLEKLLENSEEPLSFIIFLPEWRDPPTRALIRLESSRFKRKQFMVPAYQHEYRHGLQHICDLSEVAVRSSHGTLVIFFQNDAGFEKWTPTSERCSELASALERSSKGNHPLPQQTTALTS